MLLASKNPHLLRKGQKGSETFPISVLYPFPFPSPSKFKIFLTRPLGQQIAFFDHIRPPPLA